MLNFEGRKIIVTGAGKGIGKGLTQKLVELGAHVVAISRTKSDIDALTGELGDRDRFMTFSLFIPLVIHYTTVSVDNSP